MKQKLLAFLVIAFVLFSFAPTFYELRQSEHFPAGRSFELVHNYITDYNFYLSRIRQGWDGRWTVRETYTNEPHHGTIIHELYLLLGQLGRFIPDASSAVPYAYHTARAVFGLLLLSLIAWLAVRLFQKPFWQILAFLLVVTGAGWPLVSWVGETWRLNNYMPWWTVLEPLQRITFVPHIIASQAGLLFLVIAGADKETLQRKGNWILLGVVAMLTGLLMPQALLTVYGVYGVVSIIEFVFWNGKKTQVTVQEWVRTVVFPRFGIIALSVWTILYFLPLLAVYPWKRLVDFEKLHPIAFSYIEYLKTLGISLPLGIAGAVLALRRKDTVWYPIIAWALGVVGLVYTLTVFPLQHPLRFTEMAAYIPLGLLTGYFFFESTKWLRRAGAPAVRQYGLIGVYTVCFLSITYGTVAMVHQYLWQKDFIDTKMRAGWPIIAMNNYIVYPSKGFMDGIASIQSQTPKSSVILSSMVAGNYIPARTGRFVYLGHENTAYKEEKVEIVKQFFSGVMNVQDAYRWLNQERISYVFWGPQEKEEGKGAPIASRYPFLRQVFANSDVTIFQVNP